MGNRKGEKEVSFLGEGLTPQPPPNTRAVADVLKDLWGKVEKWQTGVLV